MIYNVFDTEEQANTAQASCYSMYMSNHTNTDYVATTTSWADVQQRNDGKWVYAKCPACPDGLYTEEEYQESWFE